MDHHHPHNHDHPHDHHHDHGHTHAHHDHQHEEDPYYLDQMCMVALAAAFGGICLALYTWRADMLDLVLAPWFHGAVLISGIVLLLLAGLRAACLWRQTARPGHSHEGHHHHDHDHADAAHSHEHAGHAHAHAPAHVDPHADHDHGWAPWRYVVTLIPIVLFLLGLPNRGPALAASSTVVDTSEDATQVAALVALRGDPFTQLGQAALMSLDHGGEEMPNISYRRLLDSPESPAERQMLAGKIVLLKGLYTSNRDARQVLAVSRFVRQCCAADAFQVTIPVVSKQPLTPLKDGTWVVVHGKVNYRRQGDRYLMWLSIPGQDKLAVRPPDESQYIDTK